MNLRKHHAVFAVIFTVIAAALVAACATGSKKPAETPTPSVPGPEDAIGDWVKANRNIDFIGDCGNAKQGVDIGKLCVRQSGQRGTRRAYDLGPTFSDPTALVLLEQNQDGSGWTILSVTNRDPSVPSVPGIPWPLQQGDEVIVIGLGENDCLRIREQPTQQGKQLACVPDLTKAIVQEGPTDAETFTWWRIAGNGFNGWAAGTWLRLPDAIAAALTPPTPTPAAQQ